MQPEADEGCAIDCHRTLLDEAQPQDGSPVRPVRGQQGGDAVETHGSEGLVTKQPEDAQARAPVCRVQHQREIQRSKPPAASRKLFRYLRELHQVYGD